MVATINCCYHCPDRHLKCHSTCNRYQEESKARKEMNEQIRKIKDKEYAYYSKNFRDR